MDRLSKAQKAILDGLRKHGKPMYVRDLQRNLNVKVPGRDFRDAIRILVDNDQVDIHDTSPLSGQKRKVIDLVLSDTRHQSSTGTRDKVSGVG